MLIQRISRKAVKKLKSDSGTSIVFALILFLICAAVSSVIITAATASAGRLSRLAKTEKKYYSVTSAAAALKNMIEGRQVTVERSVTATTTVTVYPEDTSRDRESERAVEDTTEIKMGDHSGKILCTYRQDESGYDSFNPDFGQTGEIKSFIPTDAAQRLVETTLTGSSDDMAFPASAHYRSEEEPIEKQLYIIPEDDMPDSIAVIIREAIFNDGTLSFTITNADKDEYGEYKEAKDPYALTVVYVPDIREVGNDPESASCTDGVREYSVAGDGSYTFERTYTSDMTTTITWTQKKI